ncbi:hypothetical protein FGS76_13275 [Alloalcanivorax gelatiniphagus]|uniref:Uncharacterized protein n=2 Tax=Alloalcanivorax gelatiniphagus TaxID=1194167 RepID=A0ABY2XJB5_9GAMM|nr:hypothetical protein [Alloalcanivorax gelatiniphagus]TMW11989.1 hypothetical protein FGS76_13275 [Alloalcanivorax gelatiniphagus]
MMAHIVWDDPGAQSVADYYAKDPNIDGEPHAGSILSARHRGQVIRVKVEAYDREAGLSHGQVAAIIDPETGKRADRHGDLAVGDRVSLPDDKRAFEPSTPDPEDEDQPS